MATEDTGTHSLSNSFTDLMTSLAVIFILLLVVLVNNKQQELAQAQKDLSDAQRRLAAAAAATTKARQEILAALRGELNQLAARGVQVTEDPKDPLGLLVVVPEGLLQFELDRSTIPPRGEGFLAEFVPRLGVIACSRREDLSSIVVEGHADSSGSEEHNLKLSQDRSIEVVRASLAVLRAYPELAGVPDQCFPDESDTLASLPPANTLGSQALQTCFLDLLSASGRGRREPFVENGVEDRARSRRVVFKIRVRSFEQRDIEGFLNG
ncbi:OmpA family protein [Candidatus Binatia bacterium]|nr:OmpA family protein [Candidatus Binatia bacterium]